MTLRSSDYISNSQVTQVTDEYIYQIAQPLLLYAAYSRTEKTAD